MSIGRRALLEAAGTGLVGGYVLRALFPFFGGWPFASSVPIQARNWTADPFVVTVRAFRGGPGGETAVFDRTVTVPAAEGDRPTERTLGELHGRHRVVVDYRDGPTVELFPGDESGDCTVVIRAPTSGSGAMDTVGVSCAV